MKQKGDIPRDEKRGGARRKKKRKLLKEIARREDVESERSGDVNEIEVRAERRTCYCKLHGLFQSPRFVPFKVGIALPPPFPFANPLAGVKNSIRNEKISIWTNSSSEI